jgi:hypothetical protein
MIKSITNYLFTNKMDSDKDMSYDEFCVHYKSLPSAIYYDDNITYRRCIRTVFNINNEKMTPYASLSTEDIYSKDEIDEESHDEMLLDSEALDTYMEYLFVLTRTKYEFQELYKKAASRMFSLDMKIGQAVLCSYDTFVWYHSIIWFYMVDPNTVLTSLPEYKKLAKYFDIKN